MRARRWSVTPPDSVNFGIGLRVAHNVETCAGVSHIIASKKERRILAAPRIVGHVEHAYLHGQFIRAVRVGEAKFELGRSSFTPGGPCAHHACALVSACCDRAVLATQPDLCTRSRGMRTQLTRTLARARSTTAVPPARTRVSLSRPHAPSRAHTNVTPVLHLQHVHGQHGFGIKQSGTLS